MAFAHQDLLGGWSSSGDVAVHEALAQAMSAVLQSYGLQIPDTSKGPVFNLCMKFWRTHEFRLRLLHKFRSERASASLRELHAEGVVYAQMPARIRELHAEGVVYAQMPARIRELHAEGVVYAQRPARIRELHAEGVVYAQMPARHGAAIRELHAEGVAYAQMPDRLSLHYQTGGSHALRCADHAQRTRRRPDPCNKRERATNTIRGGFPLYTQVHRCVSFQYDDVIDLSLYRALTAGTHVVVAATQHGRTTWGAG